MKKSMVGNKTMKRLSPMVWASGIAIGLSLVLLAVLTIVPVAVASHGNGLIHRYKFDEKGGSIALDHHKKTGAVNGVLSPTAARVKGLLGRGAVMLNGQIGSDVSFGSGVGQFGTSDFTGAFWVKTSETLRLFDLVGNRTAGSCGNFFQIRMRGIHELGNNGGIYAEISQDGSCTNFIGLQSGPGFNDGQWHHVAVTRAGTTMMLYVDGVPVASGGAAGVASVANGNPFKIGRSLADCCFDTTFTPVATFDELRLYNRALTAEQVENLADADDEDDDD